jgi:hypothetical protein
MTLDELIEELQYLQESGVPGDTAVRFASQPSWPYEYSINSVQEVQIDDEEADEPVTVIFLEEGRQLGYLPAEAIFQLGW